MATLIKLHSVGVCFMDQEGGAVIPEIQERKKNFSPHRLIFEDKSFNSATGAKTQLRDMPGRGNMLVITNYSRSFMAHFDKKADVARTFGLGTGV